MTAPSAPAEQPQGQSPAAPASAAEASAERPSCEATDSGWPSQGVRTTVNFLLFVHLFSLGALWLFGGSEMGLRQQLRRVPGYYLQLLGMDVDFDSGQRFNWELQSRDRPTAVDEAHARRLREEATDMGSRLARLRDKLMRARGGQIHEAEKELTALQDLLKQSTRAIHRRGLYHLTHADVLDVGHFLEFRYTRDGEEHVVGLPGFRRGLGDDNEVAAWPTTVGWRGFWPRQRYLRYQMLAREVGRLAGTENVQDILPAAITEGILRSEGIELSEVGQIQARLYCRRLTTRSAEAAAAARDPSADAEAYLKDPWNVRWFVTAYQKVPVAIGGRIRFSDTSGLQRDYTPAVSQ